MPRVTINDKIAREFTWHCEPKNYRVSDQQVVILPESDTDFWNNTYYGFVHSNGHFLWTPWSTDFELKAHVKYQPQHQFDQAGLMIYYSAEDWVKCSVEHEPDQPYNLGSVVTNKGYSDWATQPYDKKSVDMEFKMKRKGQDFEIYWKEHEQDAWKQLRIFHMDVPTDALFKIGIYACSPKMGGFEAIFDSITIH